MRTAGLVALFACLLVPNAATTRAAFISGVITGTVTATSGNATGISTGSVVSGSYTYDNSTTATNFFGTVNPFTAFSLTIGTNPRVLTLADLNTTIQGAPGRLIRDSTATADSLTFLFDYQTISNFLGFTVFSQGQSVTPPQIFNLNQSSTAAGAYVQYRITATPTVGSVPEPASLVLCGIAGIVGVLARRAARAVGPA